MIVLLFKLSNIITYAILIKNFNVTYIFRSNCSTTRCIRSVRSKSQRHQAYVDKWIQILSKRSKLRQNLLALLQISESMVNKQLHIFTHFFHHWRLILFFFFRFRRCKARVQTSIQNEITKFVDLQHNHVASNHVPFWFK